MTDHDAPAAVLMFADVLRQVRTDAELSQEDFAAKLNFSRSLVGMNEAGLQFPSVAYVRQVDEVFQCAGRLMRLHKLAAGEDRAGRLGQLVDAEERATMIRTYHPILVPGLLQTAAYARAVIGGGLYAVNVADRIDDLAEFRLQRQQILTGPNAPVLWVILNEASLHQVVGDTQVTREQLAHIVELTRTHRHVRVQILPRTEGRHVPAGPLSIFDTRDDGQIVHFDNPGGGSIAADVRLIQECTDWFDVLRSQAASLTESVRMIEERTEQL